MSSWRFWLKFNPGILEANWNPSLYLLCKGGFHVPETISVSSGPVTVTEAAAGKISALLAEEQRIEAGLRVFVQGGGCSGFQYGLMIEDGPGDTGADKIFSSNGVRLFVDPISIRYLNGAQVDFIDNLSGGGFTINNPNAKSTCGCGSSFGV